MKRKNARTYVFFTCKIYDYLHLREKSENIKNIIIKSLESDIKIIYMYIMYKEKKKAIRQRYLLHLCTFCLLEIFR